MVQMLENKSVRETVGQHWKDWVCQKNTRLAKARGLAKDRGLTRAEDLGDSVTMFLVTVFWRTLLNA